MMTNGAVQTKRRPPDWFEILLGLALGVGLLAAIALGLAVLAGSLWATAWFIGELMRRIGG
jgi:hypothetical protein